MNGHVDLKSVLNIVIHFSMSLAVGVLAMIFITPVFEVLVKIQPPTLLWFSQENILRIY